MRLTLRTLLAYLDDILDPEDAQILAEKIRESEFASGLVHRVRNSTRRLRLGAPPLSGKGMGLDPNTVSEYLDNTLPSDRVPDFERVCLESDVHLAEVASCHQVLTLVLGEAADVEDRVRDRIYAIHRQSADGDGPSSAATAAATNDKSQKSEEKPTKKAGKETAEKETAEKGAAATTVPDYLKSKSESQGRPVMWFAITLVLSILFVLSALRVMGPFTKEHPLVAALFGSSPQDPGQSAEPKKKGAQPDGPQASSQSKQVAASAKGDQASKKQKAAAVAKKDSASNSGSQSGKQEATSGKAKAVTSSKGSGAGKSVTGAKAASAKKKQLGGGSGIKLGTSITNTQVLARYNAGSSQWNRMKPRAAIHDGDRLLALPTYRPQVLLSAGLHLTLAGHTDVTLRSGQNPTNPLLQIAEGRLLVMTVDKAGAQVEFDLAGRKATATLQNADSEMAVEVRWYLAPGNDPEKNKPQRVIQVIATAGSVLWDDGSTKTAIATNKVARMLDNAAATVVDAGRLPAWVTNKERTSFDMLSSETLKEFLVPDRPLSLCLEEQISHRRYEVRSLTLRCLSAMGRFEPCVRAFRDAHSRSIWSSLFASLRKAIRTGPDQAKNVRVALEKLRADDAQQLYRMLWGYSSLELKTTGAKELVDALEHQQLDVRIFAIENLRLITNSTLQYYPDRSAARRRTPVFKWRDRLKKGQIEYKVQPAPFPPLVAAGAGKKS